MVPHLHRAPRRPTGRACPGREADLDPRGPGSRPPGKSGPRQPLHLPHLEPAGRAPGRRRLGVPAGLSAGAPAAGPARDPRPAGPASIDPGPPRRSDAGRLAPPPAGAAVADRAGYGGPAGRIRRPDGRPGPGRRRQAHRHDGRGPGRHADTHYVIPAQRLAEVIDRARVDVLFDPPPLEFAGRKGPVTWTFDVSRLDPLPAGTVVEVVFESPAAGRRAFAAASAGYALFSARVTPVDPREPDPVDVLAPGSDEPLRVLDLEVSAGGERLRLRDLRRLEAQPSPHGCTEADGRPVSGPIRRPPGTLEGRRGQKPAAVDLAAAGSLTLLCPPTKPRTDPVCEIVVRKGDRGPGTAPLDGPLAGAGAPLVLSGRRGAVRATRSRPPRSARRPRPSAGRGSGPPGDLPAAERRPASAARRPAGPPARRHDRRPGRGRRGAATCCSCSRIGAGSPSSTQTRPTSWRACPWPTATPCSPPAPRRRSSSIRRWDSSTASTWPRRGWTARPPCRSPAGSTPSAWDATRPAHC